jgi:hypothetical protein
VPPAVSIESITFVVNSMERAVRAGDTLQAAPGDRVQVMTVTICVGPFSGNPGEACVDFAPADASGQEVASEHRGTHLVALTTGLISIPGPEHVWSIGPGWSQFCAVVNHWPPGSTRDAGCASGGCERDDRVVVELR